VAIFSLRHTWLGKSHEKYKPGVAKAHANYVTRTSSCTKLIGKRAPLGREALKAWLDRAENNDRKNARIVDKLIIALPVELNPAQREALVRDFCEQASKGRASWVAAMHDKGKDAHNPHVHVIFRDRDYQSGRRVMMTSERGSTERFRLCWEESANRALERAGLDIRIDRRTLAAQGIDRRAGIHLGPGRSHLRNPFDAERSPTEHRNRRHTPDHESFDWTGRGGMVAQQRSAMKWVKAANERARAVSPFDGSRAGPDDVPEWPHQPPSRGR
jgi:MobA/MobL family